MQRRARARWLSLLLACAVPALAADPAPNAAQPEPAPAKPAATPPGETLEAVTATILAVGPKRLLVVRSGSATQPGAPRVFDFTVSPEVAVSGAGRARWADLARGDPVLVNYVDTGGDRPQARKVTVLSRPIPIDTLIMAEAGFPLEKPPKRSFVGYIKKVDGDVIDVMRPRAAPPVNRPSQLKRFVRRPNTKVAVLRDSWTSLKKGDRVKIEFEKGNPRPADLVQVIWRGGEKPLPPGVATRLFDPTYDRTVKDVDGIGETGQVPASVRKLRPERKIKIKLPRT
jgi:hypothetical protein